MHDELLEAIESLDLGVADAQAKLMAVTDLIEEVRYQATQLDLVVEEQDPEPAGITHDDIDIQVSGNSVIVTFSMSESAPARLRFYAVKSPEEYRYTAEELSSRWGGPGAPHRQTIKDLLPGSYRIASQTLKDNEWIDVSPVQTFVIAGEQLETSGGLNANAYSKKEFKPNLPPLPKYLETITDATFGANVKRVSGYAGVEAVPGSSTWTTYNRHQGSKVCPWNIDSSLMILKAQGSTKKDGYGAPEYILCDGQTHEVVKALYPLGSKGQPANEMRWTDQPAKLLCVGGNEVFYWNVDTDTNQTIVTIPQANQLYIGPWEGNLDHKCEKLIVIDTHDRINRNRKAYSINLMVGSALLFTPEMGIPDVDHVGVSASAKFTNVTGRWIEPAEGWIDGDRTQIRNAYGIIFQTDEYGRPSHWDWGKDSDGNEVIVGVQKVNSGNGRLLAKDVQTGIEKYHTEEGYIQHTSCRNTLLPGYAFCTYSGYAVRVYQDELCKIPLDGSGKVERWCKLHAVDWNAECVPSPDGKSVMFTSNWDVPGGPTHVFVASIPETQSKKVESKSVDWPNWNGMPPSIEADSKGESKTFTYNGKTIRVENLDFDSRSSYAKRSAVTARANNEPSFVILNDGTIYDLDTGEEKGQSNLKGIRADWSVPAVAYGFSGQVLKEFDVETQASVEWQDYTRFFDEGAKLDIGPWEGNFDARNHRVIVCDYNGSTVARQVVATDMQSGIHVSRAKSQIIDDAKEIYGFNFTGVDHVSVSPCGEFVVASVEANPKNDKRYVLYDFPFNSPRLFGNKNYRAAHGTFHKGKQDQRMMISVHWDDLTAVNLEYHDKVYSIGWGSHGHLSGHPDHNLFVHSTEKDDFSIVRVGQFDGDLYDGRTQTKDKDYLGTTLVPKSPTMQKVIGRYENTGEKYPNSAQGVLSPDGLSAVITGQGRSKDYTMVATLG